MTGCDKDATWRSLDDACRAPGWSEDGIEDGVEQRLLPFRGVQGAGCVKGDWLKPDWTIEKMRGDDRTLSVFWLDGKLGVVTIQNVEVLLPTYAEVPSPPADAPATSPAPPRKVSKAGRGYQTARVDRALDDLETKGLKLSDYTDAELRLLALKQIPKRDGEALPSRHTLNRAIRRRR
jgi:hypothetical protein